jgi:hypothetical protein
LGLKVNDFDFLVPDNSLLLAKKVRRKLGAVGFTLDDERQTARLILDQGKARNSFWILSASLGAAYWKTCAPRFHHQYPCH